MFNGHSSWENCHFAVEDERSLYDDNMDGSNNKNHNYAPYKNEWELQSTSSYAVSANSSPAVSPTQMFGNTSPINNEPCVNITQQFPMQQPLPQTMGCYGPNNGRGPIPVVYPREPQCMLPSAEYQRSGCRFGGAMAQPMIQQHPAQIQQQQQQLQQQPQQMMIAPQFPPSPPPPAYQCQQQRPHVVPQFYQPQRASGGFHPAASAPCVGNQPWTYAYCYGYAYNNQEPCQYSQFVDIEDFMNNEKRKEKSRDAARCRRSRETEIFSELAQILPLKKEDVNQLDKASVMRIAITYLKIRDMLQLFPKIQELTGELMLDCNIDDDDSNSASQMSLDSSKSSEKFDLLKCAEASQFIKQTLDGFLIILSNDGDITYVSDNVTEYLGIAKIDVLGQQIWEYSHQCDHAELKEALNIKRNGLADKVKDENLLEEGLSTDHRDLFVRLKCTLTSRGRSINIKSASYKVIHMTGHLVVNKKGDRVLVAIGRPIPHPSNIEIPLGTTTFLTKHSLDMKFTYVDDKMQNLFGYTAEDLLEKSLFDCHHGADSDSLMGTFKTVLSKGQGETCRYRFLGKYGGYCWILTQATIVYDKLKPQSVVCVNYVISNLEHNNEIYSLAQYEASKQQQQLDDNKTEQQPSSSSSSNNNDVKQQLAESKQPIQIENSTANKTHNNNNTTITNKNNNNTTNNNNNKNIITKTEQLIKSSTIKTTNPPPTTTTTPPVIQISPPPNSSIVNNNDLDLDICSNIAIKREQSPPLPNNTNNNNSSTLTSADQQRKFIDSKPPLLISEQSNCKNIENNNNNNVLNIKAKLYEEKRPKSVTASVFRSAPLANSNSELPLPPSSAIYPPLNAAPRATSVTASVFTPISQLCNKQQQHIVKTNSTTKAAIISQQLKQQQQTTQHQQQDMSKGYLSFGDDANELTMLKEEPDELEQLTPSAVDACMPLEETAPLFGEMLSLMNAYFLPDEINSLDSSASSSTDTNQKCHNNTSNNGGNTDLMSTFSCFFPGEINSLDSSASSSHEVNQKCNTSNHNSNSNSNTSSHSNYSSRSNLSGNNNSNNNSNANSNNNNTNNGKSGGRIDPFINYREESNDTNCSQHLLSPSVASKSPEASSLPSLCSPNSLSQDDEFAFITMNVDDEIDMTMRAPYIPMSEQEDLPLLTDDLMWCGSNSFADLSMQKDVGDIQQLQQLQTCENNRNMLHGTGDSYHDQQQQHLSQTHFSNSLCSSPASTVSSLSPSPVSSQQKSQQDNGGVFGTESSELAALLCGTGSGTLSILGNTTGGSGSDESERVVQQQQQQRNLNALGNGGNGGSSCGDFRLQQLQQQLQQQRRQQQQQQQQQLLSLNIDCKKEKYDSSISPNLCDSIGDAFENVYSKDSTNLDCWNEFLQINVNDTSSSSSPSTSTLTSPQQSHLVDDCKQQLPLEQQLQLKPQQAHPQNIVLNAVPLITIQSNKNLLLQQQQQQHELQQRSKFLTHEEALLAAASQEGHNKVTTIKLLNGTTGTTIANTATIRVVESGKMQTANGKTQQQQHHQSAHKRHLVSSVATTQLETKRMKSTGSNTAATIELHNVPQLLQQLVAPMPQPSPQVVNMKELKTPSKTPVSRWTSGNSQQFKCLPQQTTTTQQEQQKQQSNSVLKNLLISGCDDTIMHSPPSMGGGCLSPSLTKPLHCQTSTASVLRNYRHNPMIGGVDMQPSPVFGPIDDSSPPGLTSCDTDSNSDSGIDDISMTDAASPLKLPLDNDKERNTPHKESLLMECFNTAMGKKLAVKKEEQQVVVPATVAAPTKAVAAKIVADDINDDVKEDRNNPLMTPFLMDLCNDDYNMNAEPFLETNDIEHVLNEWTHEMA